MKTIIKIVLTIVLTIGAFLLIFGILHLATGNSYEPRGRGWVAIPILCWFAASTIVNRSGYWSRDAAVGLARAGIKASSAAKAVSEKSLSIIDEANQREIRKKPTRHTAPPDYFEQSQSKREDFVRGAQQSMMLAGNPLPDISGPRKEMLVELYGTHWFEENHELISACLVFLMDYRFAVDPDVQRVRAFPHGTPESCLRNAFNCVRLAGVLSTPTLPKQLPDPLAFALALGVDNPGDALMSSNSDTNLIIMAIKLYAG